MSSSKWTVEEDADYRVDAYGATRITPSDTKTFIPYTRWQAHFTQVISKYPCIEVQVATGWTREDCEDLARVTGVSYVLANNDPPVDISPLQTMQWLKGIHISKGKFSSGFDFGNLESLEGAVVTWNKKITGLFEHTGIRTLLIDNYPYEDLRPFAGMRSLVDLEVRSRLKLKSLDGCEQLSQLEALRFVFCPHLEISKTDEFPQALKYLSFHSAKRLGRLDPLARLPHLSYLHFDTCGVIESLKPVAGCRELEELHCVEVKFTDGDMSFIPRLPNLWNMRLKWCKHYRPSRLEVERPVWERKQAKQRSSNSTGLH